MVGLFVFKEKRGVKSMKVNHLKNGNVITIKLTGELGHHEARDVISYIENVIDLNTKENINLDLSELSFMDS